MSAPSYGPFVSSESMYEQKVMVELGYHES